MSAKERIAAIRLLEHLRQHPAYAATLGVEVVLQARDPAKKQE